MQRMLRCIAQNDLKHCERRRERALLSRTEKERERKKKNSQSLKINTIKYASNVHIGFFVYKLGTHMKSPTTIKWYFLAVRKKNPVDFDDELKIGDVRYDNMI